MNQGNRLGRVKLAPNLTILWVLHVCPLKKMLPALLGKKVSHSDRTLSVFLLSEGKSSYWCLDHNSGSDLNPMHPSIHSQSIVHQLHSGHWACRWINKTEPQFSRSWWSDSGDHLAVRLVQHGVSVTTAELRWAQATWAWRGGTGAWPHYVKWSCFERVFLIRCARTFPMQSSSTLSPQPTPGKAFCSSYSPNQTLCFATVGTRLWVTTGGRG